MCCGEVKLLSWPDVLDTTWGRSQFLSAFLWPCWTQTAVEMSFYSGSDSVTCLSHVEFVTFCAVCKITCDWESGSTADTELDLVKWQRLHLPVSPPTWQIESVWVRTHYFLHRHWTLALDVNREVQSHPIWLSFLRTLDHFAGFLTLCATDVFQLFGAQH